MSQYYNPRRTRNLYEPKSKTPFRISRSKIDLFVECPKCFYLDRKLGVGRPPGYPFSLNSAVDHLLKKEFDFHRAEATAHPLMEEYGIDAVPFEHQKMDDWRDSLRKGIEFSHKPTNLLVSGGVDDIWLNADGELLIVDYKATAKDAEVTLDAEWQDGYKRQMEIYQWLLRHTPDVDLPVSNIGYFVYANGKRDKKAFDKRLEFDIKIIPYEGDDSWVEGALKDIYKTLQKDEIPKANPDCDYCRYRYAVQDVVHGPRKKGSDEE